jgi:dTMP kinase
METSSPGEQTTMKKFITFEGIDGSGKSTIAQQVHLRLKNLNKKVILTVEPTNTPVGEFVNECIKKNTDPYIITFAFISDRILHCKQITTWLKENNIVLCDRYAESTYAYQGAQLAATLENPIHWLQDLSHNRILTPDRTFLFDLDPEIALKRIQNRDELIPFEKVSFLKMVRSNYLALAKGPRFRILDATSSIDTLVEKCIKDIMQ